MFCPIQWKQARSSAVLSQMMWHLLQMFHTLVGERKSLKQPRLPQGLAFVPPRKHSSLASPLKNKDGETSALSCRLSRNSSSGTADLNKRLLYKSHNSSWLHAPVQADVCVCGWENITHFREKKLNFISLNHFLIPFIESSLTSTGASLRYAAAVV